ncbi:hypothetical protein SLEP1_g4814 [Rubroshorea leprosula]|uniref:Uncharacterized protein n=1 Tax=Rubroshorea leprosula TaxID=152421 RepID=A0AAV5HVQ5_9ROSI|nr:hypothetical protein SLEP1_g4814 [Rubroshorea leprosula]
MDKAAMKNFKEENGYREERMSAIQAIKSISKWLYWKPPNAGGSMSECHQNLTHIPQKSKEQDINKLQDAVAARKQARNSLRTISSWNQTVGITTGTRFPQDKPFLPQLMVSLILLKLLQSLCIP